MHYSHYSYRNFNDAYVEVLDVIRHCGISSSPRGRGTRELLALNFTILDPVDRIINSKVRDVNIFYSIGSFLWIMSQSNDLAFISYYNQRGANFSDDGKVLSGAYGKRIFDIDGVNQYYQCLRELQIDPDSRRAIITFHLPQHDWRGSLDTPCTANVQFLIRDGKLHVINSMRSQSAAMVMPYDIFFMTMLQEYTAIQLGVDVGHYTQSCNSIHIYSNEIGLVDEIIMEKAEPRAKMAAMPKETNLDTIKKLLGFEKQLRFSAEVLKYNSAMTLDWNYWLDEANKLGLPSYWENIAIVLIAKAMEFSGKEKRETIDDFWDYFMPLPYRTYR
jgi:thymidylate synthase